MSTAAPGLMPTPWTHLGEGPEHRSRALLGFLQPAPDLDEDWSVDDDGQGHALYFLTPTGVVADDSGVYAVGTVNGSDRLISVHPASGAVRWTASVPDAIADSNSTPTIDENNGTVLVAAGDRVTAISTAGSEAWHATLMGNVINASPIVTTDLGPRDRAFVTDFSLGSNGRLYCINVDPRDGAINPYDPGDIVWAKNLGCPTAGNTPAYEGGVVYIAAASSGGSNAGVVFAFDATATSEPTAPIWTFTNVINAGFFGGVCVRSGYVYASSYGFYGDELGSNTVKLNAGTGALVWSTPSNRTNMMPVVYQGRVYVSGGLPDDPSFPSYGTYPTVQAFDATTGSLVWNSVQDTWDDLDTDGEIDEDEYLPIGGWVIQPFVLTGVGRAYLIVGATPAPPAYAFDPSDRLIMIDLSVAPNPALDFVVDEYLGAGSSPAYYNGRVYTVGPDRLSAVGP